VDKKKGLKCGDDIYNISEVAGLDKNSGPYSGRFE